MPIFPKNIIVVVFFVGIIILQVFLSKRENKWFGLVLPTVNIIVSIVAVYSMAFFQKQSITEMIVQFIVIFLVWNILTIILMSIYFACRDSLKKKKEVAKMNV